MEELKTKIRNFVKERDWEKFHSPKSLAIGLSIESAELLEIFQWLTEEESKTLNKNQLAKLRQEIGDVMIYLEELADKFGFDPVDCAIEKLDVNIDRYPAILVKGNAKKYNEY